MRLRFALALSILSLAATSIAMAQEPPPYTEDRYPFSACLSVASEAPHPDHPNTAVAFAGMGAGIVSLNVNNWANPVDYPNSSAPNRAFLQGAARNMDLFRSSAGFDRLYVAAGIAGLDSYDLTQLPQLTPKAGQFWPSWEAGMRPFGQPCRSGFCDPM